MQKGNILNPGSKLGNSKFSVPSGLSGLSLSLGTIQDEELNFSIKKLNKKDAITKEKALDDLVNLIETKDVDVLNDAFPHFVQVYKRNAIYESNHLIRDLFNKRLGSWAKKLDRKITSHLKSLLPMWWLAMFDPTRECAFSARAALQGVFPASPKKYIGLLKVMEGDFLRLTNRLLRSTVEETSEFFPGDSREDMEERHVRILAAAIGGIAEAVHILCQPRIFASKLAQLQQSINNNTHTSILSSNSNNNLISNNSLTSSLTTTPFDSNSKTEIEIVKAALAECSGFENEIDKWIDPPPSDDQTLAGNFNALSLTASSSSLRKFLTGGAGHLPLWQYLSRDKYSLTIRWAASRALCKVFDAFHNAGMALPAKGGGSSGGKAPAGGLVEAVVGTLMDKELLAMSQLHDVGLTPVSLLSKLVRLGAKQSANSWVYWTLAEGDDDQCKDDNSNSKNSTVVSGLQNIVDTLKVGGFGEGAILDLAQLFATIPPSLLIVAQLKLKLGGNETERLPAIVALLLSILLSATPPPGVSPPRLKEVILPVFFDVAIFFITRRLIPSSQSPHLSKLVQEIRAFLKQCVVSIPLKRLLGTNCNEIQWISDNIPVIIHQSTGANRNFSSLEHRHLVKMCTVPLVSMGYDGCFALELVTRDIVESFLTLPSHPDKFHHHAATSTSSQFRHKDSLVNFLLAITCTDIPVEFKLKPSLLSSLSSLISPALRTIMCESPVSHNSNSLPYKLCLSLCELGIHSDPIALGILDRIGAMLESSHSSSEDNLSRFHVSRPAEVNNAYLAIDSLISTKAQHLRIYARFLLEVLLPTLAEGIASKLIRKSESNQDSTMITESQFTSFLRMLDDFAAPFIRILFATVGSPMYKILWEAILTSFFLPLTSSLSQAFSSSASQSFAWSSPNNNGDTTLISSLHYFFPNNQLCPFPPHVDATLISCMFALISRCHWNLRLQVDSEPATSLLLEIMQNNLGNYCFSSFASPPSLIMLPPSPSLPSTVSPTLSLSPASVSELFAKPSTATNYIQAASFDQSTLLSHPFLCALVIKFLTNALVPLSMPLSVASPFSHVVHEAYLPANALTTKSSKRSKNKLKLSKGASPLGPYALLSGSHILLLISFVIKSSDSICIHSKPMAESLVRAITLLTEKILSKLIMRNASDVVHPCLFICLAAAVRVSTLAAFSPVYATESNNDMLASARRNICMRLIHMQLIWSTSMNGRAIESDATRAVSNFHLSYGCSNSSLTREMSRDLSGTSLLAQSINPAASTANILPSTTSSSNTHLAPNVSSTSAAREDETPLYPYHTLLDLSVFKQFIRHETIALLTVCPATDKAALLLSLVHSSSIKSGIVASPIPVDTAQRLPGHLNYFPLNLIELADSAASFAESMSATTSTSVESSSRTAMEKVDDSALLCISEFIPPVITECALNQFLKNPTLVVNISCLDFLSTLIDVSDGQVSSSSLLLSFNSLLSPDSSLELLDAHGRSPSPLAPHIAPSAPYLRAIVRNALHRPFASAGLAGALADCTQTCIFCGNTETDDSELSSPIRGVCDPPEPKNVRGVTTTSGVRKVLARIGVINADGEPFSVSEKRDMKTAKIFAKSKDFSPCALMNSIDRSDSNLTACFNGASSEENSVVYPCKNKYQCAKLRLQCASKVSSLLAQLLIVHSTNLGEGSALNALKRSLQIDISTPFDIDNSMTDASTSFSTPPVSMNNSPSLSASLVLSMFFSSAVWQGSSSVCSARVARIVSEFLTPILLTTNLEFTDLTTSTVNLIPNAPNPQVGGILELALLEMVAEAFLSECVNSSANFRTSELVRVILRLASSIPNVSSTSRSKIVLDILRRIKLIALPLCCDALGLDIKPLLNHNEQDIQLVNSRKVDFSSESENSKIRLLIAAEAVFCSSIGTLADCLKIRPETLSAKDVDESLATAKIFRNECRSLLKMMINRASTSNFSSNSPSSGTIQITDSLMSKQWRLVCKCISVIGTAITIANDHVYLCLQNIEARIKNNKSFPGNITNDKSSLSTDKDKLKNISSKLSPKLISPYNEDFDPIIREVSYESSDDNDNDADGISDEDTSSKTHNVLFKERSKGLTTKILDEENLETATDSLTHSTLDDCLDSDDSLASNCLNRSLQSLLGYDTVETILTSILAPALRFAANHAIKTKRFLCMKDISSSDAITYKDCAALAALGEAAALMVTSKSETHQKDLSSYNAIKEKTLTSLKMGLWNDCIALLSLFDDYLTNYDLVTVGIRSMLALLTSFVDLLKEKRLTQDNSEFIVALSSKSLRQILPVWDRYFLDAVLETTSIHGGPLKLASCSTVRCITPFYIVLIQQDAVNLLRALDGALPSDAIERLTAALPLCKGLVNIDVVPGALELVRNFTGFGKKCLAVTSANSRATIANGGIPKRIPMRNLIGALGRVLDFASTAGEAYTQMRSRRSDSSARDSSDNRLKDDNSLNDDSNESAGAILLQVDSFARAVSVWEAVEASQSERDRIVLEGLLMLQKTLMWIFGQDMSCLLMRSFPLFAAAIQRRLAATDFANRSESDCNESSQSLLELESVIHPDDMVENLSNLSCWAMVLKVIDDAHSTHSPLAPLLHSLFRVDTATLGVASRLLHEDAANGSDLVNEVESRLLREQQAFDQQQTQLHVALTNRANQDDSEDIVESDAYGKDIEDTTTAILSWLPLKSESKSVEIVRSASNVVCLVEDSPEWAYDLPDIVQLIGDLEKRLASEEFAKFHHSSQRKQKGGAIASNRVSQSEEVAAEAAVLSPQQDDEDDLAEGDEDVQLEHEALHTTLAAANSYLHWRRTVSRLDLLRLLVESSFAFISVLSQEHVQVPSFCSQVMLRDWSLLNISNNLVPFWGRDSPASRPSFNQLTRKSVAIYQNVALFPISNLAGNLNFSGAPPALVLLPNSLPFSLPTLPLGLPKDLKSVRQVQSIMRPAACLAPAFPTSSAVEFLLVNTPLATSVSVPSINSMKSNKPSSKSSTSKNKKPVFGMNMAMNCKCVSSACTCILSPSNVIQNSLKSIACDSEIPALLDWRAVYSRLAQGLVSNGFDSSFLPPQFKDLPFDFEDSDSSTNFNWFTPWNVSIFWLMALKAMVHLNSLFPAAIRSLLQTGMTSNSGCHIITCNNNSYSNNNSLLLFTKKVISPFSLSIQRSLLTDGILGKSDDVTLAINTSNTNNTNDDAFVSVKVQFVSNDVCFTLNVNIPQSYPLRIAEVEMLCPGVPKRILAGWNISTMKMLRTRTIAAAVESWTMNVRGFIGGLCECPICLSVAHSQSNSLPSSGCPTCKNKFHSECLLKWLRTSHNSKCPLCRQPL